MKKYIILASLMLSAGSAFAGLGNQNIFNPIEFTGTEEQKVEVVASIERGVYQTYCVGLDMCSDSTLRMMETSELDSFKYLIQIRGLSNASKALYNRVVQTYCVDVDMCSYSTIKMMYDSEVDASKQTLTF